MVLLWVAFFMCVFKCEIKKKNYNYIEHAGQKGWGRDRGSKAGIFLEEEGNERCLYLEIELDVRDERKRITWRVGGVLNPSWPRPWVHSNTDTHAHIHTLAHIALKHTDTDGWSKTELVRNNKKGKEKIKFEEEEVRRRKIKSRNKEGEKGKAIMFSSITACWINVVYLYKGVKTHLLIQKQKIQLCSLGFYVHLIAWV